MRKNSSDAPSTASSVGAQMIGAEDWTEVTFDASHQLYGDVHGHTWFVRVFWLAVPYRDARVMHQKLDEIVRVGFDHRTLETVLDDASNLGVAKAIAALMSDLTEIWVWRMGRVPCGVRLRL